MGINYRLMKANTVKKDNTFNTSYEYINELVSQIKDDQGITSEDDDSRMGRICTNLQNHLEKIANAWKQLSHSKEQLEDFKLKTHVNNKIKQEALKSSIKRGKVETTQKMSQMEKGYKALQKQYTNYIVGYENDKV